MEKADSGRSPPPSRPIPDPPDDADHNESFTNASPPQSDSSALASPHESTAEFHTPLTQSPTTEHPPLLPPKDAVHESKDQGQSSANASTSAELTSLRAHYLKKELVHLQFRKELTSLTNVPTNNISTFSYLGPPFTPPPKDGPRLDLPFLRFVFRRFVLSFPFLAAAPKDFFPEKLQPFMASLMSRNLSPASPLDIRPENSEEAARLKMLNKLEKNLAMLITSGTKLTEPEDVVRLTQRDLDRLEAMAKKRAAREKKLKDSFEVNVVCVRTVVEKKRVRSKVHEVHLCSIFCYNTKLIE